MTDKKIGINIEKPDIKADLTPIAEGIKTNLDLLPAGANKFFVALLGEKYINNKRHEILTLTQLQKEIDAIKSGVAVYDKHTQTLVPSATNHSSPLVIEDAVIDEKNRSEAVNILKSSKTAFDILLERQDIAEDSEFPYTFFYHWRDAAKLITEADIQAMWGRIIAEKISFPSSVSLKTLDILRVVTTSDLQEFIQLCKYVVNDEAIAHFPLEEDAASMLENWFLHFIDLGIISVETKGVKIYVSGFTAADVSFVNMDNGRFGLQYGNYFIVTPDQPQLCYRYRLTIAGKELYKIVKQDMTYKDVKFFCDLLATHKKLEPSNEVDLYTIEHDGNNELIESLKY